LGHGGYSKNENGPGLEAAFYLAMDAAGGAELGLHGP
jgi:hypothetical protein